MLPKFRAWLKDEKKMVDVGLIDPTVQSIAPDGNEYGCWFVYQDNRDCVLMQWNGRTDKNGKEIYEGDIVKTDEDGWIAVVKFDGCNFYLEDDKGGYSDIAINWDGCEIIGNIYENSELLEKK
jgi:uncharacterized phage protein (TIGR01671 family)